MRTRGFTVQQQNVGALRIVVATRSVLFMGFEFLRFSRRSLTAIVRIIHAVNERLLDGTNIAM
jgi:hypothetical protein